MKDGKICIEKRKIKAKIWRNTLRISRKTWLRQRGIEKEFIDYQEEILIKSRDVNGADKVQTLYPTRWINICSVPVLISVGYPLCRYPPIFFISAGIHVHRGYLQNYFKNKYLIINSNKIKYIIVINFK